MQSGRTHGNIIPAHFAYRALTAEEEALVSNVRARVAGGPMQHIFDEDGWVSRAVGRRVKGLGVAVSVDERKAGVEVERTARLAGRTKKVRGQRRRVGT